MLALVCTLPDVRKKGKKKWFPVSFLGSIAWIGVFSICMVEWATLICEQIGIDITVMGLVVLSAGTSAAHDDDQWVDNLRLTLPPTKPPPPSLLQATARTLELAWFPPHHGGAPITLYRLQRRTPHGWVTAYVGSATTRRVSRGWPLSSSPRTTVSMSTVAAILPPSYSGTSPPQSPRNGPSPTRAHPAV